MAEDIFAQILSELKRSNDAIAKSQKDSSSTSSKTATGVKPNQDPLKKILDQFTTPVVRQFRGLIDELKKGFQTLFNSLGTGARRGMGRGIGSGLARAGAGFAADYAAIRLGLGHGGRPTLAAGRAAEVRRFATMGLSPSFQNQLQQGVDEAETTRLNYPRRDYSKAYDITKRLRERMGFRRKTPRNFLSESGSRAGGKVFQSFLSDMRDERNTEDKFNLKKLIGNMAKLPHSIGQSSSAAGGAFSKMSGTMGSAARSAIGEVGGAGLGSLGVVAGAATAVVGAFTALVVGSNALLESNKKIMGFNSQLASSYAHASVRQVGRNISLANDAGPGLARMNDAMQDLKDAWTPIEGQMERFWTDFATPMLKVVTGLLSFFTSSKDKKPGEGLTAWTAPFRNYNSGADGYDWRRMPQRPDPDAGLDKSPQAGFRAGPAGNGGWFQGGGGFTI